VPEYSPSLNRASTDLEALLPTLVEAYRVQQQNCLDTMIRCTTEYGVHRRIVAAATVVGGVILVGSRHYSPIMRAQADTSVHEKAEGRFEGFIDQYDVWVDRKLAYEIVQANGQHFDPERNRSSKELYSEGVW